QPCVIHQINFAENRIQQLRKIKPISRDFLEYFQIPNHCFCLRPLDAEQSISGGNLKDLRVICDNVPFEALGNSRLEARLKIQKQFIGQTVDVQIALHATFGSDQCRIAALTHLQSLNVIRDLTVKKADSVGAGQTKAATETEVQHAGSLAQCSVFGCLVP